MAYEHLFSTNNRGRSWLRRRTEGNFKFTLKLLGLFLKRMAKRRMVLEEDGKDQLD